MLSRLTSKEVLEHLASDPLVKLTPKTVDNILSAAESVERCRTYGWAECDEELEMGVRSIAVPISNSSNKTIAALSLSVRAERMTMDDFRGVHLAAIQEARNELIRLKVTF